MPSIMHEMPFWLTITLLLGAHGFAASKAKRRLQSPRAALFLSLGTLIAGIILAAIGPLLQAVAFNVESLWSRHSSFYYFQPPSSVTNPGWLLHWGVLPGGLAAAAALATRGWWRTCLASGLTATSLFTLVDLVDVANAIPWPIGVSSWTILTLMILTVNLSGGLLFGSIIASWSEWLEVLLSKKYLPVKAGPLRLHLLFPLAVIPFLALCIGIFAWLVGHPSTPLRVHLKEWISLTVSLREGWIDGRLIQGNHDLDWVSIEIGDTKPAIKVPEATVSRLYSQEPNGPLRIQVWSAPMDEAHSELEALFSENIPLPLSWSEGVFEVEGDLQLDKQPSNGTMQGGMLLYLLKTSGYEGHFGGERIADKYSLSMEPDDGPYLFYVPLPLGDGILQKQGCKIEFSLSKPPRFDGRYGFPFRIEKQAEMNVVLALRGALELSDSDDRKLALVGDPDSHSISAVVLRVTAPGVLVFAGRLATARFTTCQQAAHVMNSLHITSMESRVLEASVRIGTDSTTLSPFDRIRIDQCELQVREVEGELIVEGEAEDFVVNGVQMIARRWDRISGPSKSFFFTVVLTVLGIVARWIYQRRRGVGLA